MLPFPFQRSPIIRIPFARDFARLLKYFPSATSSYRTINHPTLNNALPNDETKYGPLSPITGMEHEIKGMSWLSAVQTTNMLATISDRPPDTLLRTGHPLSL